MNSNSKCRGLTAEEELVLMQMLDVKMFLKKEALKEQITSVRKKSLSSVSSLSQGLFYPSIFQMKELISKTTTSTPPNSRSWYESSGSENSVEDQEAPKTCPQRRRHTQPWLLERGEEEKACSSTEVSSSIPSDDCLDYLDLKIPPKLQKLGSDDSSRITVEVTLQFNAEERHLSVRVHGYRIKGINTEYCQELYIKTTLMKEKGKWIAIAKKRQPLSSPKKMLFKLPSGSNLCLSIQVKRERGFRIKNHLIGSLDLGPKICGASNSAHWEATLGCPGVPFVMCHRLDDGPGLAGS